MDNECIKIYAFIDGQNLYLGTKNNIYKKICNDWYELIYEGWPLDYNKFKTYLKDKYNVSKVYYFIGYDERNSTLYKFLQENDYIIVFSVVLLFISGIED